MSNDGRGAAMKFSLIIRRLIAGLNRFIPSVLLGELYRIPPVPAPGPDEYTPGWWKYLRGPGALEGIVEGPPLSACGWQSYVSRCGE